MGTTTVDNSVPTPLTIKRTCSFLSKNASDTTLWEGTIKAVEIDSDIAQMFSTDIVSYNAAVRQADPTVSNDITTLNFFLVEVTLSDGTSTQKMPFAIEWIADGSFQYTDTTTIFTLLVYAAAASDQDDILTTLRSAGYQADVTNVVTNTATS